MKSRWGFQLALGIALTTVICTGAFAQYGGGTTGGGPAGMGGGVYTAPKGGYSSSTGIAIGAGAAAGVGVAYLALRHRGVVTGCLEPAGNDIRLVSAGKNKTYMLNAAGLDLKPGEKVKLKIKKLKTTSGEKQFDAQKLMKDYGPCNAQAAAMRSPKP